MAQPYETIIATNEQVARRIDEMAREIITRYQGRNALFICMLRGGAPFATQLMFAITRQDPDFHPEMDYATIKTYGDERTHKPSELLSDVQPSTIVKDRPIVLLDDILDKGITAAFATQHYTERGAASVELIVLAEKQRERTAYGSAALSGFAVPDDWIIGMGLDNASHAKEANRWGDYIAIANH